MGAITAAALAPLSAVLLKPAFSLANIGDLYGYHYPLRHLVASGLQAGRLPFWNPYIFAGLPLAANPQSSLYYPPALLGRLFPLNASFSWDFAFHFAWAVWGAGLLGLRGGLRPLGAALLAALYALSPFLVYRVYEGIPTLLASLAWAPWCWLFWLAGRPGYLAAAWTLQLFSGHPQFAAINAAGMLIWAACGPGRAALLGRWVLAAALAAAAGAVSWAPLLEFLRRSVRGEWPAAFALAYSVDFRMLLCAILPGFAGNPLKGTFPQPASVFLEGAGLFIGWLGLGLAAWGFFRGGRRALVLAGVGVFLALGANNPVFALLLKGPMGFLRTPARYLFLSLWGLLLAAGFAWRGFERSGRLPAAARLCAVLVAVFELLRWDAPFLRAEDSRGFLKPHAAISQALAGRPFRVMTDPELASSNKTMLYRAMNVNGYEAFFLGGFPEYAYRSEGSAAVDASRAYLRKYDSPEMSRLAVRYFLRADGKLIESSQAQPLASFLGPASSGVLDVALPSPERWRITGRVPKDAAPIVVSQPFYPGWTAHVNGVVAPMRPWDGFLQSLELPANLKPGAALRIDLRFRPTLWPLWVGMSVLAWAFWLARQRLGA